MRLLAGPTSIQACLTLVLVVFGVSLLLYISTSENGSFWQIIWSASSDPTTYLPYTFGYAALLQTLHAYEYVSWKNIVVVDNSWDHHAFAERDRLLAEFKSLKGVIKTPVHLRFSQLQGMIDGIARGQGEEVYLWGHTDVVVLRNGTAPYATMKKCLKFAQSLDPVFLAPYGVMFFAYDLLSAVFTHASAAAPWDPAMPQYGSDCDRYRRLRLAGYAVADCPISIGSITHTHAVLTHDEKAKLWGSGLKVEQQVDLLEEINAASEQYAWRNGAGPKPADGASVEEEEDWHDGVRQFDLEAAAAEGSGGNQYYEAKWGPFTCELEDRIPNFDIDPIRTPH
ncbi:hypothetical protein BCR39DRAFT_550741 [Naematelia encephala]|uniref:Uncharacterized protein n=1 Tax=Naematelia encephala TaxID=71784 RepID=A0A1Y2AK18_9TREE|nr:hypothetical protein BCR39DRAFT_550741 [Naematelia encephala]